MKVQALLLKPSKQHMTAGKVYEVTDETGNILIEGKKAVKAKADAKVGKVYDLPGTNPKGNTQKKNIKKGDDLLG